MGEHSATFLSVLLYYITDRSQFPGTEEEKHAQLLDNIAAAARWGVDFIQLREKDLSARELELLALQAVAVVRRNNDSTKLLINSRADIAVAAGADGVHLRSAGADASASDARIIFHKAENINPVIACSCHSLQEVADAEAHGADFAVFGPVFGKGTVQGVGIDALREICEREIAASSRMPVLALGGVTVENAMSCLEAGAAGIAGIRLFQSGELGQTISELRRLHPQPTATAPRRRHPYQPG
ncbi:MAG: thiamine-phosphate diphosphorylase [Candidatus Angelobacter sp.]|jgi:thiamine-phosphate pyrophosphorylase|nr:thiamine-phosphate diphosphorylase [Candidatus Angelobacter sp.]